jgi:hypothetical protein
LLLLPPGGGADALDEQPANQKLAASVRVKVIDFFGAKRSIVMVTLMIGRTTSSTNFFPNPSNRDGVG